jgi:transcriptional repressor NrdR
LEAARNRSGTTNKEAPAVKCPYCGHLDNKVIDSRLNKECTITRRRRSCLACDQRFTTYERLEVMMPMLVKKDGRREPWNRTKMVSGLEKACEKRPVSIDRIDEFVDEIEHRLQDMGSKEVQTQVIGEWVMEELSHLDEVAYVRFASVYRQFKDVNEFMSELKLLLDSRSEDEE